MKNKFLNKIIVIICMFCLFNLFAAPSIVKAEDGFLGNITKKGKSFIDGGRVQVSGGTVGEVNSDIFNILLGIGIVLTVGVGGFLGIQFMIASAEDKAKVKEKMIPYVLGCMVIYGAFIIWKVVITVLEQTN